MGHYCRICHNYRPNEKFSGSGHRNHICRKCRKLPAQTRFRIEAFDEIGGFLTQSNISAKNLKRLAVLAASDDEEVREMASLVAAIGRSHPGRRNRYRSIKTNKPELWRRMLAKGLVMDWGHSDSEDDDLAELAEIEDADKSSDLMEGFEDDDLPF